MSDSQASPSRAHQRMHSAAHIFGAARLCDVFVLGFCAWTLLANFAVFWGANLRQLETAALWSVLALALSLALAALLLWRRRSAPGVAPGVDPVLQARLMEAGAEVPPGRLRLAVAIASLAVAALYLYTGSNLLLWGCGAALLVGLAARELAGGGVPPRGTQVAESAGARQPIEAALLLGLCLACAAFTLLVHRADPDDAFYVNIAVAAADHPGAPLIAYDTLHGLPELPLALPVYRVHAVELFTALVSHRSGIPVLTVAHLWLPALVAFLVPLAWARLLRLVMPRTWLWGVFFCVAYLLLAGGASHGHPDFSFVRLQQGKSVMLTLCMPLIIAYAIEFALAPRGWPWLRLAAAQIAAVGMSASALWLAPATAALALASARRPGKRSLAVLAFGLTASLYPLLLAFSLRGATESAFRNAVVRISAAATNSDTLLAEAAKVSLGHDGVTLLILAALLGSGCVASSALLRRLCIAFGLAFFLVFWSPLTASWIATHVTSVPTYWRVFWLLPVPLLAVAFVSAPLSWDALRAPTWLAYGAATLCGALLLGFGPSAYSFSASNGAWIGRGNWKVPPALLPAALATQEHAGPGDLVLASKEVAPWIPVFHRHPTPLVVRINYLPLLAGRLDDAELERRISLVRLVTGIRRPPHAEQLLADAVRGYPLQVVVLSRSALHWSGLTAVLSGEGMTRVHADERFEVWARSRD